MNNQALGPLIATCIKCGIAFRSKVKPGKDFTKCIQQIASLYKTGDPLPWVEWKSKKKYLFAHKKVEVFHVALNAVEEVTSVILENFRTVHLFHARSFNSFNSWW